MSFLYNQILYIPLLNALIIIYNHLSFSDLGLAVIILTLIIRIILFPLFHKGSKSQALIQKIQPKIKEISEKYKDNKEEQVKKILEVYKENKVNPLSGIFLLLVQLPVLIALFHVFYYGLSSETLTGLYSFVTIPEKINFSFLGLINLQQTSIIIVVLAALFQYIQAKLSIAKVSSSDSANPGNKMAKQMALIGPFITFIILFRLPSVIGIYWITTSVFSIFQQIIINKSIEKDERRNEKNIRRDDQPDEYR